MHWLGPDEHLRDLTAQELRMFWLFINEAERK
jgi:hypothetical protein